MADARQRSWQSSADHSGILQRMAGPKKQRHTAQRIFARLKNEHAYQVA